MQEWARQTRALSPYIVNAMPLAQQQAMATVLEQIAVFTSQPAYADAPMEQELNADALQFVPTTVPQPKGTPNGQPPKATDAAFRKVQRQTSRAIHQEQLIDGQITQQVTAQINGMEKRLAQQIGEDKDSSAASQLRMEEFCFPNTKTVANLIAMINPLQAMMQAQMQQGLHGVPIASPAQQPAQAAQAAQARVFSALVAHATPVEKPEAREEAPPTAPNQRSRSRERANAPRDDSKSKCSRAAATAERAKRRLNLSASLTPSGEAAESTGAPPVLIRASPQGEDDDLDSDA